LDPIRKEILIMKDRLLFKVIRTGILFLSLAIPLEMITAAQTPTATPYTYARTESIERGSGDNWGWIGLLGLAGLLGLLRRRETYTREQVRTADTTAGRSSY
jgi:MYXO-CTERM domain-containing protein